MKHWLELLLLLLAASALAKLPEARFVIPGNRGELAPQAQFDAANRVTNTISPLQRSQGVVFNDRGLPFLLHQPFGNTATNTYDARSRLTNHSDSVATTLFGLDLNGNITLLTNVGQASGLSFGFDGRDLKYSPRNLSKELSKLGRFPVDQCVTLGLYLTTALEYLQSKGLIHRDIKPSNIIFVGDIPKLADIGLVSEIASEGRQLTYVGTEGYIPPEGPGTAAGDVYSLGKVLYEAGMGRDRLQYPDLPTSLVEGAANTGLMRLNEIILKACESDAKRRYQSAAELHADLLRLQQRLQTTRTC